MSDESTVTILKGKEVLKEFNILEKLVRRGTFHVGIRILGPLVQTLLLNLIMYPQSRCEWKNLIVGVLPDLAYTDGTATVGGRNSVSDVHTLHPMCICKVFQ
jgi:hypothetical protein